MIGGRLTGNPDGADPWHDEEVAEPGAGRLVYDGDCAFCTRCAAWLAEGGVSVVPWQRLDLHAVDLTEAQVGASVWWLVEGRAVDHSSRAIGRALTVRRGVASYLGRVLLIPALRPLADAVYRVVARHRHRLPGGTPACRLDRVEEPDPRDQH